VLGAVEERSFGRFSAFWRIRNLYRAGSIGIWMIFFG
jgi:hypothetical protein